MSIVVAADLTNLKRASLVKVVGVPWPKNIFFEFIVGLDRVAQDKLFGVGMTLQRPRVCLLDTIKLSKNSFWEIAISDHVKVDGQKLFVQGCA